MDMTDSLADENSRNLTWIHPARKRLNSGKKMGGKKWEPCVYLLPPVFLPFKFFSYHANTPHHRNRSPAILGHPVGFSWNTNIDVDKSHPINPIRRSFDRGTYSIELSGRSQAYAIDRVMILKHEKEPIFDFDASKRTLDS